MQTIDIEWSQTEQKVAKEAFDKAYEREIKGLMALVQEKAGAIAQLDDMWSLHDFLSAKRHEIDGKYDYRYSFLIFVFARLVKEEWLHINELEGLAQEKLAKIAALSRM
jgi:Photoprotection regulator fluorescence recovery protein